MSGRHLIVCERGGVAVFAAAIALQHHEGLHDGEPVVAKPVGIMSGQGRGAVGVNAREAHHAAGRTNTAIALGTVATQCGHNSRHTRTLVAQLFRNL